MIMSVYTVLSRQYKGNNRHHPTQRINTQLSHQHCTHATKDASLNRAHSRLSQTLISFRFHVTICSADALTVSYVVCVRHLIYETTRISERIRKESNKSRMRKHSFSFVYCHADAAIYSLHRMQIIIFYLLHENFPFTVCELWLSFDSGRFQGYKSCSRS